MTKLVARQGVGSAGETRHVTRLTAWSGSRRGDWPVETQFGDTQAGDERIGGANQGVLRHLITDASWRQTDLISAIAVDEALSLSPAVSTD